MEEHGDVVVGERHVVAVGAPDAAVVGNKDKKGVVVPGLSACHAHETANGPVGVFHNLIAEVVAAGCEVDVFRQDVRGVVAAGHDGGEEGALCGGMAAMAQGVVEHDMVGDSPGADDLRGGVAVLPYYAVETVAEEESAHVVEVFVVGHEIGGVVACIVEDLGHAVDAGDGGLFHGVAGGDAGAGVEGGIDAVVGVDAGGIGAGEGERLCYEAVETGGERGGAGDREGGFLDGHGFHDDEHDIGALWQGEV